MPGPSFQPTPSTRLTCTWADSEGKKSKTTFWLPYGVSGLGGPVTAAAGDSVTLSYVEPLVTILAGYSEANLEQISITQDYFNSFDLPTPSEYANAEDKALLVIGDSGTGQSTQIYLVAPAASVFGADQETVTTVVGAEIALSMKTNLFGLKNTGADGDFSYIRGYFKRSKTRRKFSPGYATETGGD